MAMTVTATTRRIAECVAITIAIPAIGFLIDPADPFFLRHRFPWIVFAPLLVALRHGFRLGFSSAAVLVIALIGAWRTRIVPLASFPGEPVVGLVALAMISGQFADLWRRESLRRDGELALVRSEADRLARAHFLLETSHDRLDEQLQRKTTSLREAMEAVKELPDLGSLHAHGGAILDVYTTYCGLEIGELFEVDSGLLGPRCASAGRPEPMRADDPLLLQAVRSARLTYIPTASVPGRDRRPSDSPLLAAIPFVDSSGRVRAVLCIQAMPFLSFDKRNLDTMVTIAATIADHLVEDARPREPRVPLIKGATA